MGNHKSSINSSRLDCSYDSKPKRVSTNTNSFKSEKNLIQIPFDNMFSDEIQRSVSREVKEDNRQIYKINLKDSTQFHSLLKETQEIIKVQVNKNLFLLTYDSNDNIIRIKDPQSLFYFKINEQIALQDSYILIGSTKIFIRILPNHVLNLRFSKGRHKNMNILILPTKNANVHIGRSKKNDFVLDEITVSRVHCRICYDGSKWLLYDGNQACPSSDGTWMLIDRFFPLYSGIILKKDDSANFSI